MRGSSFFEGVGQLDIEIGGQPGKTPTFYYDAACMTAVFPARFGRLRELMPDTRYVPARLAPGLGALVVAALEYRDTDVGPYNELAIGVPLCVPAFRANLPGRAMVAAARRRRQHLFVLHLPVTTDVALRGGIDFYNFPKFLAGIDFTEVPEQRSARLSEGAEHILTLRGQRIRATKSARLDLYNHLWMDGQPQSAQFTMNQLDVGATRRRGTALLELGDRHPIALELDRLLLSRSAIRYEYTPRMEAILFGPEHLTLPLVHRALEAARALEHRPVA